MGMAAYSVHKFTAGFVDRKSTENNSKNGRQQTLTTDTNIEKVP